MRIARRLAAVSAALSVCLLATIANADHIPQRATPSADNSVTLTYDPATGALAANNGGGTNMTALELISAGGMFNPDNVPAGTLGGLFDVGAADKLFKLEPNGFAELNFGNVLPTGLSFDDLHADMSVDGAMAGGGGLANPGLYVVPEPSSLALLGLGMIGLLRLRRRS